MQILPPALTDLIEAFGLLPGVGPRTAERYAYYLVRHASDEPDKLSAALLDLRSGIGYCRKTFALIPSDQEFSDLYTDPRRDITTVAVVAEPFDLVAIEKTNQYNGTYHVLGGLISPIDGIGPEQLHLNELIARIDDDAVEEIILATNASVEGEFERAPGNNLKLGSVALVGIVTLGRIKPLGIDVAIFGELESVRRGPDVVAAKLLLEKRVGAFDARFNLAAEKPHGQPVELGYAASADVEGAPSFTNPVPCAGSTARAARLRLPDSTLIAAVRRGTSLTVTADQRCSLPSGCISFNV